MAPGGIAGGEFGLLGQAMVTGRVFSDHSGDGAQDQSENGIGGVLISLISATGELMTTMTSGDGSYSFDGVAPGLYTVQQTNPAGFSSTTPDQVAVLVPAEGSTSVVFGDRPDGTVSGLVFNDLNGDGIRQRAEAGIGRVAITLWSDAGIIAAATTAADGAFVFTEVGVGAYRVKETDPQGFVSTTSNEGDISLSAGEPSASVSFGDQLAGSVSGVVFRDANGDGEQSAGEDGIAGVLITLALQDTGVQSTTTVGNGSYIFAEVPDGAHTVAETDADGWTSTTPNLAAITVSSGRSASANFADLPVGTVSGSVFSDQDGDGQQGSGERGIGGVTVTLSRLDGSWSTTETTAMGGTYVFSGVGAGDYYVEETNPEGIDSTTDDRVRITVALGGSATANFGDRIPVRHTVHLPLVMRGWAGNGVYLPLVLR